MATRYEIEANIAHHAEQLAQWRIMLAELEEQPAEMPIVVDGKLVCTVVFDDGEGEGKDGG